MSEQTAQCNVVVTNPQGLHARPADLFVRLAGQFKAEVVVIKEDQRVNGKGIWDILTLGAQQGTQLSIEATGEDAQQAVEALARLVNGGFAEGETEQ